MYRLTKPQKLIYDMEKFSQGAIAVICGSVLRKGHQDLSELNHAINELYRINDALRTHIVETDGETMQSVSGFSEQNAETLHFASKMELEAYAAEYAKQPLNFYGNLCEIKIVLLPDQHGALIKMHHIIGDAWSLSLLASQFCAILDGETPTAYPYMEYAATETEYLQSKRYEKDKAYFLEQFKKCEEVTYLSEKQSDSLAAARKTFVIGTEQSRRISAYAETRRTSLFMLFMTALAAYMNRTKMNAERFYIGTTVLNRTGVREKNIVGMFINTVPMLIELSSERTFAENLSSIADSAFSVFRHQKYNYGDVLADIRKEYGFSERLYDVMLSYQNAKIGGNAESAWYHSGAQAESLQVHIDDRDREGIFRVHFDYRLDKFAEHEIERMYGHVINLLLEAISNDSKPLHELEILSVNEKQKLLCDFNDTTIDYPRNKCVHELFEEQVKKAPEKTAIIACDRTLTYGELNEQANRIAHSLIEQGVKAGDIVAFVLPRRSYLIAAVFGILKVGAAYLPIDSDYPMDRINYMIEDSRIAFLITTENTSTLLAHSNVCNPNVVITPDYPCYCIYTSGSTGRPKSTMVKHRGVVNYSSNVDNNLAVYEIAKNGGQSIVSVTTASFDLFTTESSLPLMNGWKVILADEKQAMIQHELNILLTREKADVLQTTPTKMRSLIGDPTECAYLNSLKAIILGGEVVDSALIYALKRLTSARIFSIYGPTETTVWSTNTEILSETEITIGKPIANTQIYIVDRYMQPVPIGVTGELCIAGDGVGAGYLNRPELTAEKFIDNPFGNGKLYKSGDLGYWREDGVIIFVGRNDFQVKIRGLRIELGEIENAIQGVEGILQAVVTVRKVEDGRQLICAFYTGQKTDGKALRAAIGQKLPKYMLPHIFTHLNELPLTASGKVNRKALPEVDLSQLSDISEYIAPEGEVETRLAALMEQVLNHSPIGRDDDFFDLGGDSLKAIELVSALESAGYHTDVRTLFANATVREFAAKLTPVEQPAIPVYEIAGDIPATPAQMRVYTAQAMQGETAYNVPFAFRAESVEPDKLQTAVQVLVDRHETLRTRFEDRDGRIMQVVEPKASIEIERLDSDDISAFVRPFDLGKAPLLRVGYCGNTVMVDMHHIITDGGSMPIFFRELNELYMGRELKQSTVQYRQFSAQPQDYVESEAYWLSVFSDEVPVLELNTDFRREQKRGYSGDAIYTTFDSALHQKIVAASRRLGITPYVFYIGGFYILLSKFSGNEDIVVGTPMSGRSGAYLDTIGMFVNTVALRGKPAGTKTVSEFLAEVKAFSIDAVTHQDYPYGELVKKLGANSTDRNPLFDVVFAYQDNAMTDVVFGDKPAEILPIPVTTAKYDFTFNILPRKNNVVVMAEYCTDLYRESTLQHFIDGYTLVLEQMLNAGGLLKDISAITEQERQKLLFDFNDTAVDYPRDKCVHQLFEEQVEKTSEKTALIACDRTLTYGELNEQANRIANGLIEKGVKPGDIVAFALPRRSYLITAMFGILKAGAAYLPIDSDYPQDRIDYIMQDSKASYLILEADIEDLSKNGNVANPNIILPSDSLCYCIYTSGTTGQPKGVLISHSCVINFAQKNCVNSFQKTLIDNCSTVLCCNSVTFDIVLQEIFLPLLNGLSISLLFDARIYAPTTNLMPGDKLGLIITPTKLELYIENEQFLRQILQQTSVIMCGAEPFPVKLLNQIRKYTDAVVFNGYGPTETTCGVLYSHITDADDITIGQPIANTQIYIVDCYMQPVPTGVTGELCIAGDGVGAGYLNCPELTAEKFIDNPFGNGKLYKTGDLAYWREDGNIVYVGRNDFQVKIRGLRIELGEIENAIQGVQGIIQAVVTVRKDEDGRQLICAFYTGQETDGKKLRAAIGQKLPKYMLPHIFTRLDELPLTASGKVNRKALPEMDLSNIATAEEYVPPVGETEKRLAALMEQVLEYAPIGRDDDFFDLGGDSLKAIEFVSKAHSDGIYFSLQSIFDYPTVRTLYAHIESGDRPSVSYADDDFTEINKLLAKNQLDKLTVPPQQEVGNILLAGATGFLGIHILADFLDHDSGTAYCLIRGGDQSASQKRLHDLLDFYFDGEYADLLGVRIRVICGDLQKDGLGLSEQEYHTLQERVDTVINAAASVKHYGSYQYFYEANVVSTQRLIDFCLTADAKLIHISTLSVSGNSFGDQFDGYISETEKHFYETDLFIGQPLKNVYARSKFEAEKAVLEGMAAGLRANIMRMGNLTNRLKDGKFQINHETNAFAQRIKGALELGMIPDYLITEKMYLEFTPIDEAANAIMTITRHFSEEQTVFHINSTKVVYLDTLQKYFTELGYEVKTVSGVEFTEGLRQTAKRTGTEHIFETFINDMDADDHLSYDSNIRIENRFTEQYLKHLGFQWSEIGLEYLRKYISFFEEIGYWRKIYE